MLGFAYFLTATALITIFQENLADTERATVMPLWFMAFGGTIPIGNLIFGPVIDAIGARWVLGFGAVVRRRSWPGGATCAACRPTTSSDPTPTTPAVAGHGVVAD